MRYFNWDNQKNWISSEGLIHCTNAVVAVSDVVAAVSDVVAAVVGNLWAIKNKVMQFGFKI